MCLFGFRNVSLSRQAKDAFVVRGETGMPEAFETACYFSRFPQLTEWSMPARSPEECDQLFAQHMNAGDLGALIALYEPGSTLVQRDGRVVAGSDAIRANFEQVFARKPRIVCEIVKVVTNEDKDLAIVHNDWRVITKGDDGRTVETTGKAIEIMRRQPDGSWLFVIDEPYAR
jgi:uncharacterized protein (TIGR02246 family)